MYAGSVSFFSFGATRPSIDGASPSGACAHVPDSTIEVSDSKGAPRSKRGAAATAAAPQGASRAAAGTAGDAALAGALAHGEARCGGGGSRTVLTSTVGVAMDRCARFGNLMGSCLMTPASAEGLSTKSTHQDTALPREASMPMRRHVRLADDDNASADMPGPLKQQSAEVSRSEERVTSRKAGQDASAAAAAPEGGEGGRAFKSKTSAKLRDYTKVR